jgi:hypothetical protein
MGTLKEAIEALFDGDVAVEVAVDRHFAPSFRQRVDGAWIDRAAFVAGIAELRESVESAAIEVLDELAAGDRYAERHVIELRRRQGGPIRQEVYVFAERDPHGRFTRIEEAAVPLESEATQAA